MPTLNYRDNDTGAVVALDVTNPTDAGDIHFRGPGFGMTSLPAAEFRDKYSLQLPSVDATAIPNVPASAIPNIWKGIDVEELFGELEEKIDEAANRVIRHIDALAGQAQRTTPAPSSPAPPAEPPKT
jgi:hypothetical protein